MFRRLQSSQSTCIQLCRNEMVWWCDDVMMINGPERSPERLRTKHYGSALIPPCRNEWPRQMRTSSGATEISDGQQNAECIPTSVKLRGYGM